MKRGMIEELDTDTTQYHNFLYQAKTMVSVNDYHNRLPQLPILIL